MEDIIAISKHSNLYQQPEEQAQQVPPELEGVDLNAPLTGEEIAELIKLRTSGQLDWNPTRDDYGTYTEWSKNQHSNILSSLMEAGGAVLGDIGRGVGSLISSPIDNSAKFAPSLVEAFAQGTRNLYGMVAQSSDPNSKLFRLKNALMHENSDEGYSQFIDALNFNKDSTDLATGKSTIIVNKDYIDHDMTLAMSYIADPTLFIPFGAVAGVAGKALGTGAKAIGMGEHLLNIGAKVEGFKTAVIGGGLKYAVGTPIEFIGGATRATIEGGARITGRVFETATGMSASEFAGVARASGVGLTAGSIAGHSIPIVSDVSRLWVGSNALTGIGEAVRTLGEQYTKQAGKRGFNSFAKQALIDTEKAGIQLSNHAKGLLNVLDAVDPMASYAGSIAGGALHGMAIGGTLGYLNAGEEGFAHGLGAGMALGGVGAGVGRVYKTFSGGTLFERAAVQGKLVYESAKSYKPDLASFIENGLARVKTQEQLTRFYQVIGGIDNVAPDASFRIYGESDWRKAVREKGYDPDTGQLLDKDGKPAIDPKTGKEYLPNDKINQERFGFEQGARGWVSVKDKTTGAHEIFINSDAWTDNTLTHEVWHSMLKHTSMYSEFMRGFGEKLLGKFDANGKRVENSKIDPNEFRQFVQNYHKAVFGDKSPFDAKSLDNAILDFQKNGGDWTKMTEGNVKILKNNIEEFGAHYFAEMLADKPVDYLFYAGNLPSVRNALETFHNNFVDFWQKKVQKVNPSFDFSGGKLDEAFRPDGGRVVVPELDAMVKDLLNMKKGLKPRDSVGIRDMTKDGKTQFIDSNGIDGLRGILDENGNIVAGDKKTLEGSIKTRLNEQGKKIFQALQGYKQKNPNDTSVRIEYNKKHGNYVEFNHENLSEGALVHLVNEGLISQALADRIKTVRDIINGKGSNTFNTDYHAITEQIAGTNENARKTGADVSRKNRDIIPVEMNIRFSDKGDNVLSIYGVDRNAFNERLQSQWRDQNVRVLWGDNFSEFEKSFAEYLANGSKPESERVQSALLPSLSRGDAYGEQRRNVMHQVLGFKKVKNGKYINPPTKEIVYGNAGDVTKLPQTNFRLDLMSPLNIDESSGRLNLTRDGLDLLSMNFQPKLRKTESTPNGRIEHYTDGYRISFDSETGVYKVFFKNKQLSLKPFESKDDAVDFINKDSLGNEKLKQNAVSLIDVLFGRQQKEFKPLSDIEIAEARKTGDVFELSRIKELTSGTQVVRQTRQEFVLSKLLKLRQSSSSEIYNIFETAGKVGNEIFGKIKEYGKVLAEIEKQSGLEFTSDLLKFEPDLIPEYEKVFEKLRKLSDEYERIKDVHRLYKRAESIKNESSIDDAGNFLKDKFNEIRENRSLYEHIAKTLFVNEYDTQFKTGEAVSVIATHGTLSNRLLLERMFDVQKLGERFENPDDKFGVFLSGSTLTSENYSTSEGYTGVNKLGQKARVSKQVRAIVRMDKPLVVDFANSRYDGVAYAKIFKTAVDGGHDGVIITNVKDGGDNDTIFIPRKDIVKSNTAIIDTHSGFVGFDKNSEMVVSKSENQSIGRGKDVLVGTQLEMAWQPKEYRGTHKAPSGKYGEGSLDAMDRTYPDDLYSSQGARYYGSGDKTDKKMHELIMKFRGKPDAMVTVYRAVPKGVDASITKGDWVTPLREYAVLHGNRWEQGMTLLEKKVKASELFTEGNSLYEFGWNPEKQTEVKKPKSETDSNNINYQPKDVSSKPKSYEEIPVGVRRLIPPDMDFVFRQAQGEERLLYNVDSSKFAGKPVLIVKYDRNGVGTIVSPDGKALGKIHGGVEHPIISGYLNNGEHAVVATTTPSHKKLFKRLQDKTDSLGYKNSAILVVVGGENMGISGTEYGRIVNNTLSDFVDKGILSKNDFNKAIKYVSEKTNKKGEYTGIEDFKSIVDKPYEEQLSFLDKWLSPDISNFKTRKDAVNSLLINLGKSESFKDNALKIKEYFKSRSSPTSATGIIDMFNKLLSSPLTYDSNGKPLEYGRVIAAFEIPTKSPIVSKEGKHPSFPVDFRSEDGTKPIINIFANPPRLTDMVNNVHGRDVGSQYTSHTKKAIKEGKPPTERRSIDIVISTTGTTALGWVKTGSHIERPLDLNNKMTKSQLNEKTDMSFQPRSVVDLTAKEGRYKVPKIVSNAVSRIDAILAKNQSNKNGELWSVSDPYLLKRIEAFKTALGKQSATDEVYVPEVAQMYSELLDIIDNKISYSESKESLAQLNKVRAELSKIRYNIKGYSMKAESKALKNYKADLQEGADIESEQAYERQDLAEQYKADMQEGADIESEQVFAEKDNAIDMAEKAKADAEKAKADAERASIEAEKARTQAPYPEFTPELMPEDKAKMAWRTWTSENTPNGSIQTNGMGFKFIISNAKIKVYNPQNALLGIYTDLEQAKRRVLREESKKQ